MQNQIFISCLAWIHRGFAANIPIQLQIPQQQIEQIKKDPMITQQYHHPLLIDQKNNKKVKSNKICKTNNKMAYRYLLPTSAKCQAIIRTYSVLTQLIDDLQADQKQDYLIRDTDALIVTGKIQQQFSSLQIYVYQQQKNNLYVHHELMLTSFPLAIQWLNINLGSIGSNNPTKGNYAIVSSFLTEIQIWNLDIAQTVEPDMILGGQAISNKKKPKKFTNKPKKYKQGSHTDSVLSLSLNTSHKNILASGSADKTLKIWDLAQGKNIYTSTHHHSRVNKVKWNPTDKTVILTASQDKTLAVLDSRFPNDSLFHKLSNQQSSIESACWNVNQPVQICYTTDKGMLYTIDVRQMDKTLISVSPHQGNIITDIKIGQKNLCYTCSQDESVRIWNINNFTTPLSLKKPKCGKMFCLDLMENEDGPIIACGNGKGQLFVWDVTENVNVANHWKSN